MTALLVFAAVVVVAWTAGSVVYACALARRWLHDPVRRLNRKERRLRRDAARMPADHLAEMYHRYAAVENGARRYRQHIRHDLDAEDVAYRLAALDQAIAQGEARRQMIAGELLRRDEYWRVVR